MRFISDSSPAICRSFSSNPDLRPITIREESKLLCGRNNDASIAQNRITALKVCQSADFSSSGTSSPRFTITAAASPFTNAHHLHVSAAKRSEFLRPLHHDFRSGLL
jgi:hypothetical protein